jgi:tetratricopeptide (TPR) repeat protein
MPDAVAEVEYLVLLDMRPRDYETRYKLGMIYFRKQEYDKAADHFQRVLKAKPKHFNALTGMGLVKTRLREYDQAVEYYKQAIAVNPADNHVYYYFGKVLELQNKIVQAQKAYQAAVTNHIKLYGDDPEDESESKDLAEFQAALESLQASKAP